MLTKGWNEKITEISVCADSSTKEKQSIVG